MLEIEWEPKPIVYADQFAQMADALSNLEVPLEESLYPVMQSTESHFEEEGPGWAPWAESYAPVAEVTNVGGILWRTGALVEGATSPGSYDVTPTAIYWTGADAPDYGGFHLEGTSKMPARPFIGLDDASEAEIVGIFEAWLDSITGAGLNPLGASNIRSIITPSGPRLGGTIPGQGFRFLPNNYLH